MQQPKMIVLGLLSQGLKYGLEMEEFIERVKMRFWVKLGGSTVYKTLNDLRKDNAVTARRGAAKRGPGKNVYKLTKTGETEFTRLVGEALSSREPVYSDRIAGLFFACSLPREVALPQIATTIKGLSEAIKGLELERANKLELDFATVVLDYYITVYKAELTALETVKTDII
jgi:DNA-binding PadR family transcriptional regulator